MAFIASTGASLRAAEVDRFIRDQLDDPRFDRARVCVVVPDATRSCPLAELVDSVFSALHGRAAHLQVLIALGTHAAMSQPQIEAMFEVEPGGLERRYPGMPVINHEWWDPDALTTLGVIPADTLAELSEGRLRRDVTVSINRAAVEFDELLIVGPVFPHEVVGFSGGNKYLFPGISGQDMIDVSHWLGALISSSRIIGTLGITPVRALIDQAASLVPARVSALCAVVKSGTHDLLGLSCGDARSAWAEAARLSSSVHVEYLDSPVKRVLSIIPDRYDEMWTAAKGMYKVDPIVADGGEVVIFAPHVKTASFTHGPELAEVGYHIRDYFTGQWDRFKDHPWGVLAHSTHLRGTGSWSIAEGERPRITVTLATGISREETEALGLRYLDPASVSIEREIADPDTLVVPNAGEVLFRLTNDRL